MHVEGVVLDQGHGVGEPFVLLLGGADGVLGDVHGAGGGRHGGDRQRWGSPTKTHTHTPRWRSRSAEAVRGKGFRAQCHVSVNAMPTGTSDPLTSILRARPAGPSHPPLVTCLFIYSENIFICAVWLLDGTSRLIS